MGTDFAEYVETLPTSDDIKVHRLMCAELIRLVIRVNKIFPEIEAARPRCSSGIDALVSLRSAVDKAKLLLQQCSESSKLYLALTGEVILSRCKKSRNLLQQSLSEIHNMVPVLLAVEISRLISDLGGARFCMDPSEKEAGNIVQQLLYQYESSSDSAEEVAFRAIQAAALRLHITSKNAVFIEKRSIKKFIGKLGEGNQQKRKILLCFLNLLIKYGDVIVEEQKRNGFIQHERHVSHSKSRVQSAEVESCVKKGSHEVHVDIFNQSALPDEFKCPLSSRLMYDPVVISSGQTVERMWIQRWFDEGNDTCPKTRMKLADLSITPNTAMKDLISKWCAAHGETIPDPSLLPTIDRTSSHSFASLSSSLNDLSLPMDFSNVSLGSLDASHTSDRTRTIYGLNKRLTNVGDGSVRFHSGANAHEMDLDCLSKLDTLSWEFQFSEVENVLRLFEYNDKASEFIPYKDLIQPVIRFLKHAHALHDVKAQMAGCQLLLVFIKKCRKSLTCITSDSYDLLAALLNNIEVVKEAVSILESLSYHEQGRNKIAASGAHIPLLKLLNSQTTDFHELILSIFCNLSEDSEACSLLVSSDIVHTLIPFLEDARLARYCVTILKNMSYKEDGRVSVTETDGCITSLAKLLESDSRENQEQAVEIFLSLCSQRVQYCQLVMDEFVIPGLVSISLNGNDKGKCMATELLRLLRDEIVDNGECSGSEQRDGFDDNGEYSAPDQEISTYSTNTSSRERKSSCKSARIFGLFTNWRRKP